MNTRARWVLSSLLVLLFSATVAFAQQDAPGQGRRAFAQAELDQMLAPIALYPDSLLSQILMAATYPGEVVEAARWSRRNPGLNGDRAVRAVERIDWDPSVKSLVAFPQILDMMDQKLEWTEDLGDAFLDQQAQVMDTVQYLRRKAYAAGSLAPTDQFRVEFDGASLVIALANPEMVYMPYYNPLVVYGTWWWPTYQPVYWAPWPGYYSRAGYARGFAWGPGIPVSRGFFYGAPDWHRHSVNIVNVNNYYYAPSHANRPPENARNVNVAHGTANVWQHDTAHRRDVPGRDASSRRPAASAGVAPVAQHDFHDRNPSAVNGRAMPGNATVPAVAAQPEIRSAPMQSSPPATSGRPTVEQRPNAANTSDVARSAEARGPVSRGHDQSGMEGRGGSGYRPEARTDAASRPAERGGAQQTVAGISARPAVERAPVSATVPAVANPPETRSAPGQPNAQGAAGRGNGEQRPVAANATGTPAGAAHRADGPNTRSREHAGREVAASSDNSGAATGASGNGSAAQYGNSRGGGNFRQSQ